MTAVSWWRQNNKNVTASGWKYTIWSCRLTFFSFWIIIFCQAATRFYAHAYAYALQIKIKRKREWSTYTVWYIRLCCSVHQTLSRLITSHFRQYWLYDLLKLLLVWFMLPWGGRKSSHPLMAAKDLPFPFGILENKSPCFWRPLWVMGSPACLLSSESVWPNFSLCHLFTPQFSGLCPSDKQTLWLLLLCLPHY